MPIDDKVVHDVAALSRLNVDPAEAPRFVKELQSILAYVEQLQSLDVAGIEPTSQVGAGIKTPLREDQVVPSDVREEALEHAPDRDGDYFRVPRVV
jgi:aspartyl-tRNA(Asn)/glutamyl-tRNA(Gln) amidotransferase subunit C